jgi:hypothetical protein
MEIWGSEGIAPPILFRQWLQLSVELYYPASLLPGAKPPPPPVPIGIGGRVDSKAHLDAME